ncbi:MAG: hypothetical protein HY912_16965 [Desulfomonile tiedjei]|uniref:Uncharacterized protein n=1 Tax=Desulfomonile tiedjei TaxID=2358 RepID=A0A9D6V900_9BACT|nr:hypothetical protein [Desulfomonile tiedjei]
MPSSKSMFWRAIGVMRCYNHQMRILFRECIVLCISLALFPAAVILLLLHNDALSTGLAFLRRLLFAGGSLSETALDLWVKVISPYLVIQAIRAFIWSQKSIVGRKWANLYFAALLAAISAWFFSKAWDLLYFMYALGDIPDELKQFFQLEGDNILAGALSLALSIYCFSTFLNPRRGAKKKFDPEP